MGIKDLPHKNAVSYSEGHSSGRTIVRRRGHGKTTRLLALSEFHSAPILCTDERSRQIILARAERWDYDIPEVLTAQDIASGKLRLSPYKTYLADEADHLLQALISHLSDGKARIVASTITSGDASRPGSDSNG